MAKIDLIINENDRKQGDYMTIKNSRNSASQR